MATAGIILCLLFAIFGYFIEKRTVFNPVTVFCGLWSIIILLSTLGYYTMHTATNATYKIFTIGMVCYVGGYYFSKLILTKVHLKIKKHTKFFCDTDCDAVPRYRLLYVLLVVCIAYAIYSFYVIACNVGAFNLQNVQSLLQSGEYKVNHSSFLSAFSLLIIQPVSFAIPVITAVDFWYGRRDKVLFILTIIMLIVRMLSNANRTNVVLLFIYMMLTARIYLYHYRLGVIRQLSTKRIQIKKTKKYIVLIVIIAISAFVFMTMSRGANLFRNLYMNFAMPPKMFEIWAEKIASSNVYGYGIGSLLGFIYPVFYFIKNLFGLSGIPDIVQSMYDWTMMTDSTWVWPGKNIRANAYVSIFWFLYVDARWGGIIIGMFIFGIIVSKGFMHAISKKSSARQIAAYCMIFYSILFSFVRLQFTECRFVLAFCFIMFIAYKMVPKDRGDI